MFATEKSLFLVFYLLARPCPTRVHIWADVGASDGALLSGVLFQAAFSVPSSDLPTRQQDEDCSIQILFGYFLARSQFPFFIS